MPTPRWRDRIRYAFDNSMARGPIALIGWLALISLAVIATAALIIALADIRQEGGDHLSFGEAFWESLVRTLDSGTFGGDTGWGFRFVMLGVTIGGVFFVSALNANQSKPRIVILADQDIVEMKDEVTAKVGNTRNTKVIYRNGSPLDLNDLEIVNPHTARSIIILAPESDDPDSEVIKTILALVNHPNRRAAPYHIVAEISDPKNLAVARMVGKDEVQLIVTADLISRIIVQTARQSGLSVVYTELLDFGGDEIYFKEEPALVGRTFGEALLAYEDSAVIGLRDAAHRTHLNPPMETRINAGDQLISIAEDDDTIKLSGLIRSWDNVESQLALDVAAIHGAQPAAPGPSAR